MLKVNLDRFNLEKYIQKAKELDYIDLIQDIDKQIAAVVGMQKTNVEDHKKIFIDFLHELRHVMDQGVYVGVGDTHKAAIKSIISSLVDKGQINKSLLESL